MLKDVNIPKAIGKKIKTTQFGINPVVVASNEAWNLLEEIQEAIDDGELVIPSSGGLVDGDYGDITISSGGTVMEVNNGLPATVIGGGSVSNTEYSYLNNVTGPIQGQLDGKHTRLTFQEEGADLGTSGTVDVINFTGANITATRSGNTVTINVTGDSSGGRQIYTNNGATIVATGLGVTFVRTTASIWTITCPLGVDLISIDIYSATADNPGSNVTVNINTSSTIFNQSIATLRLPFVTGLNLGTGAGALQANYAPTTGAANLAPKVNSVGAGDIQLQIDNFNAASGLGAGATILKLAF